MNLLFSEPRRGIVVLLAVYVIFWGLERRQKSILLGVFGGWHGVNLVVAEILLPTKINGRLEHGIFSFLADLVEWDIIRPPLILIFIEILVGLTLVFGVVHSLDVFVWAIIRKSHTLINRIPRLWSHNTIGEFSTSLEHLAEITFQTVLFLTGDFSCRFIVCLVGDEVLVA